MNTSKKLMFAFSFLMLIVMFSSCSKDSEITDGLTENSVVSGNDDEENQDDFDLEFTDCFEIVFPITLILPDSSQVIIADQEMLEAELEAWYEQNPEVEDEFSVVFPVNIISEGMETTLANEDEFVALIESCEDEDDEEDDGDEDDGEEDEDEDEDEEDDDDKDEDDYEGEFNEDCFVVLFPLSFTLPDGTITNAADLDEALAVIEAYYEANPDIEEEPELVFPVSIEFEDGTVKEINSEEEFEMAEEDCG